MTTENTLIETSSALDIDYPPSIFAIPETYRSSLPAEIREWLTELEDKVDGLTLEDVTREARKLSSELQGPDHLPCVLIELGEQVFYNRMQEILDIMGEGRRLGIDLVWKQTDKRIPGAAVEWALCEE
jgi:hypothetical protein